MFEFLLTHTLPIYALVVLVVFGWTMRVVHRDRVGKRLDAQLREEPSPASAYSLLQPEEV